MQLCRVVPCYERSLYCRYVAVLASTYPLAAPAERDTLFLPNSCNDRKFPRHCQGNNRVLASGRPIIPTRDAGCSTGTFLCILPELPSPASLHFRLIARNQDEILLLCRNFFSRITLPCIVPVHFFCSPSFDDCLSYLAVLPLPVFPTARWMLVGWFETYGFFAHERKKFTACLFDHPFDARFIANVFVVFASATDHKTLQIKRGEGNWLFWPRDIPSAASRILVTRKIRVAKDTWKFHHRILFV